MVMFQFEVELQFMHDSLCYLTSGIMVRHMPSRKEKMVWHLQYTDWPDHGCPEDTYGFLGMGSSLYTLTCNLSAAVQVSPAHFDPLTHRPWVPRTTRPR